MQQAGSERTRGNWGGGSMMHPMVPGSFRDDLYNALRNAGWMVAFFGSGILWVLLFGAGWLMLL